MIPISFDTDIQTACPELQLGLLQCSVQVRLENPALWAAIDQGIIRRQSELGDTTAIAPLPAIQSTRRAYKSCGKDPARYRASAESLLRRAIQGKGLYRVNNVVDLLNLVSIESGFSIGGYDAKQIQGAIRLGIGKAEEDYTGIGRGSLNIAHLPVLRDELGAFGSPTSDSMRTRLQESSQEFLMVFFAFGASEALAPAMEQASDYLKQFAMATDLETQIININVG